MNMAIASKLAAGIPHLAKLFGPGAVALNTALQGWNTINGEGELGEVGDVFKCVMGGSDSSLFANLGEMAITYGAIGAMSLGPIGIAAGASLIAIKTGKDIINGDWQDLFTTVGLASGTTVGKAIGNKAVGVSNAIKTRGTTSVAKVLGKEIGGPTYKFGREFKESALAAIQAA